MAADRQITAFFQTFRMLAENSDMGQRQPELGPDIRTFSLGNYVVVYRPFAEGVEIARVVSGFRDIEALFGTS